MAGKYPSDSDLSKFSVQMELLNALLRGGICVGYENLALDHDPLVTLTVPASAQYAIITVIADGTVANADRVIHFREDGSNPTTTTAGEGMPIGDNGSYVIKNRENLLNFKAIGIENGKNHQLRIQYYA